MGIKSSDMISLTFTNRAARGMNDRIQEHGKDASGVFVGNIHRFCSMFLYDNEILSPTTSILDELDVADILNDYGLEEEFENYKRQYGKYSVWGMYSSTSEVNSLAHFIEQYRLGHPVEVMLNDYTDKICAFAQDFDIKNENPIECIEQLIDMTGEIDPQKQIDWMRLKLIQHHAEKLLIIPNILVTALSYNKYKQEYELIDYDSLLIRTYDALQNKKNSYIHSTYHWIQIDEIQDLNPIQLAIARLLEANDNQPVTTVYFGDEQQAIFSFLGSKLTNLETIKNDCKNEVLRLFRNYRSPDYLLQVFNLYSNQILKTSCNYLPTSDNNTKPGKYDLVIRRYASSAELKMAIDKPVDYYRNSYPDERIAVIVNFNKDADYVAERLELQGIACYKISGQDAFKNDSFKFLVSHLVVSQNETNFIEWARIFHQMQILPSLSHCRRLQSTLRRYAICPTDFLLYDDSTYTEEFRKTYESQDIVIFDTETTGLDVTNDEVVQIAAITIRNGEIVPDSELNLFIEVEKEIPSMLGTIKNPLVEEYASNQHLSPVEAYTRFLDYIKGKTLLGHNANYDYQIVRHNLLRFLPYVDLDSYFTNLYDSLKLMRLLKPHLRSYKLKDLLSTLNLEGANSHLANDDIIATKSVVDYCYNKSCEISISQHDILSKLFKRCIPETFRNRYLSLYEHTQENLYHSDVSVVSEMKHIYDYCLAHDIIKPLLKFNYMLEFLSSRYDKQDNTLSSQLFDSIAALRTFTEADLCDSDFIREKVFVMTVHKAKGLEFENVIVYAANDGIFPYYNSKTDTEREEDARKLFVAISRAKKRLCLTYFASNKGFPSNLSPFITKELRDMFIGN